MWMRWPEARRMPVIVPRKKWRGWGRVARFRWSCRGVGRQLRNELGRWCECPIRRRRPAPRARRLRTWPRWRPTIRRVRGAWCWRPRYWPRGYHAGPVLRPTRGPGLGQQRLVPQWWECPRMRRPQGMRSRAAIWWHPRPRTRGGSSGWASHSSLPWPWRCRPTRPKHHIPSMKGQKHHKQLHLKREPWWNNICWVCIWMYSKESTLMKQSWKCRRSNEAAILASLLTADRTPSLTIRKTDGHDRS